MVLQPMTSENVVLRCDGKTDKCNVSDAVAPLGLSVSSWVNAVLWSTFDWDIVVSQEANNNTERNFCR